jgi:O-antigen ligase
MLLIIVFGIAAAFTFLPTLRERAGYTMVTWRSYLIGERNGIYSDMGRIISYDIAAKSIVSHPLIGVGAGDVMDEMKAGYAKWYPEVPEAAQLWPHNQFLTCALAIGIPGAILFALWIIAPLRRVKRNRAGFYFILIWLMLLVPLMVDVFLEVQFGVAVFLIFLLWQRQTLIHPLPKPVTEQISSK